MKRLESKAMADARDLSPLEIFEALKAGEILLVDVREPAEFANERIHGALLHPLSTFEPKAIPTTGRRVIFQCGSGNAHAWRWTNSSQKLAQMRRT